ncbi:MAG: rod shape-determining protein MreD [candidate division Zixibacteria bacterium]|nr:rod shape-determining protein MreD [candidate division Zixibacteria bacterium]
MRLIPYILYLILISFHVVILADLTSIAGVKIDLAAFIILTVAMYKGELAALWFGFLAGLTAGATLPDAIGWYALFGAVLGLTASRVKDRMNIEAVAAKLVIVFVGVILFNFAVSSVIQAEGLGALWWRDIPAGALYTTVLAAIFFAIKHGYLTGQRFKSIF